MAIIHQATLSPSKLDLLRDYLPSWTALAEHHGDDLTQLGAYRFDDPAGNVGIETHVLSTDTGAVLQIPLVYRNDPFAVDDALFLGTMEHSVLGTRYVYEACVDPIYLQQLVTTIVDAGSEAAEVVNTPDGPVPRDPSAQVTGSGLVGGQTKPAPIAPTDIITVERVGTDTHISLGEQTLVVHHLVLDAAAPSTPHLRGVWADGSSSGTFAQLLP